MSLMSKSLLEAYICGAENALADGKSMVRGVFKLGIASHALGDHLPDESEWWEETETRIEELLYKYERRLEGQGT